MLYRCVSWASLGNVAGSGSTTGTNISVGANGTVLFATHDSNATNLYLYRRASADTSFKVVSGPAASYFNMDYTPTISSPESGVWYVAGNTSWMQYVSINDGVNWTQLGLGSGITSMIKYGAYYIAFGNGTAMYSTSPTTGWTSLGVQILNLTVVNGKLLGYSGGYICDFTNITAPVQLCYVNSSYYGDITYSNGVYAFASAGFLYWSGDGLVTFNKSQMIPNMNAYPYCRVMPWGVTSMVPNQSSYAATILFDKTAVMPPKLGDVFFPSNSTVNTHQPALKWYMRIA